MLTKKERKELERLRRRWSTGTATQDEMRRLMELRAKLQKST